MNRGIDGELRAEMAFYNLGISAGSRLITKCLGELVPVLDRESAGQEELRLRCALGMIQP